MIEVIERLQAAFLKLRWYHVPLVAAIGFLAVLIRYGWEHYDTVVPVLIGSSAGIVTVSAGFSVILIALAVGWLLNFSESKSAQLLTHLREEARDLRERDDSQGKEIGALRRELDEVRRKHHDVVNRMMVLTTAERECQAEVQDLKTALSRQGLAVPQRRRREEDGGFMEQG